MIQMFVHNLFSVRFTDLCQSCDIHTQVVMSGCPSTGTQRLDTFSLSHQFSTSPCNSNQTFQGVVTTVFIHCRGEEAGNDHFPGLCVTIHLGWGHWGCVTLTPSHHQHAADPLLDGFMCNVGKLVAPQMFSSWKN